MVTFRPTVIGGMEYSVDLKIYAGIDHVQSLMEEYMNKKRILIVCAVLLVSAAASITSRASAEADPTVMKIGDISVIAIHTSDIEMSSELVKNGDKNEIGKYIPTGKISASINAYVVKTPSHTVLVDSGMGTNDALCAQMGKAGISPDDIDLILLTHGHFDHVGGLVNNGKAVFGKARVMMAEKEAAVYGNDAINEIPQDMRKYFIPGNTVINVYKERFSTFVPGSVIVEGITSVDLNGHTPGHSGFLVGSGKKALLIAGDFMHISALQLVHPEYSLIYDSDGSKAADARKKLLETVSRNRVLMAASHFAYPGIGYIKKSGAAYTLSPVK